ncbi:hypothetical protein BH10PSE2_BH10PSE2_07710 [soil metagenome]
MKIAIQDSWPNLPENAEKEFIQRFHIACEHIGIECETVVTSADILRADPDLVVASHEFSRKLTAYPTVGLIWSPTRFFESDPYRVKSVLSYDGYTAANPRTRRWLKDNAFGLGTDKPVAEEVFLPTTYISDLKTDPIARRFNSAAYIGVHWDGGRHSDLFEVLASRGAATFYGPAGSWDHVGKSYGGALAFDGRSVLEALSKHTAVLCFHKDEHRAENTPSMRIFEACSVGAVPICDSIDFARNNLSDIALFVDLNRKPAIVAEQIEAHLEWIANNPKEAGERGRRGQRWFQDHWSLEAKIKTVLMPLHRQVMKAGLFVTESEPSALVKTPPGRLRAKPVCEVVIRTGGRDLTFLERALRSVAAASSAELPVHAVVADYKGNAKVAALCSLLETPDFGVRYVRTPDTGYRSTALWNGILACEAPFVAHLDDDDTVFPNHYRQLVQTLKRFPASNVAYSGVVLINDDPANYFKPINFFGPRDGAVKEDRDLKFLDAFDLDRLARFENFIQSNTWLARRDFVHEIMNEDPELVVVEDVYLYLLMASAGPFRFTGSATALWHWRSQTDGDNSMFAIDQNIWAESGVRVKRRLARMPFLVSALPGGLPRANDASWETASHRHAASLAFGSTVACNASFVENYRCLGFHPAGEGDGIWSKESPAIVVISITAGAAEAGGVLLVRYNAAFDPSLCDQWVQFTLSDGGATRAPVTSWNVEQIALRIPPGSNHMVTISLTTSHTINPASHGSPDNRELGARIIDIGLVRTDEYVPHVTADKLGRETVSARVAGLCYFSELEPDAAQQCFVADGPATLFAGIGSTVYAAHLDADRPLAVIDEVRASQWILVIRKADADGADSALRLSLLPLNPDDDVQAHWNKFDSHIEGRIQSHFGDPSSPYEHLACLVAARTARGGTPLDQFCLFQRMGDDLFWEVRPSYGPSWAALASLGERGVDDQGVISRGRVQAVGHMVSSAFEEPYVDRDPWIPDAARQVLSGFVYGLIREVLSTGPEAARGLAASVLISMVD